MNRSERGNRLPSIRNLRTILTVIFLAVCLLPATMFTVRQFEETRVILKDEAQILARLMRSETKHFSTPDLSPAMIDRLARDVLFDRTSMLLVSTAGNIVYSDEFLQPQPRVDYTVEVLTDYGTLGSLTLTRSIRERLPIMIGVVAGALSIAIIGLYLLHTRVFPGWLRAEEAEQLSKKRFSDIATVSSDWFWELDSHLRVSLSTLERLPELMPDNVLGKRFWDIGVIVPEQSWAHIKSAMSEQADFTFVYTVDSKGDKVWHELRGTPYFCEEGQFCGYRGAGRDITQERRAAHEITQLQEVVVHAMASLAETRDNETGNHIIRTKNYVKLLAEQLRTHPRFKDFLSNQYIEQLYKSAPLHDIGKVGIPDNILCKPGKLTTEEFEIMKTHTTVGYEAIERAEKALGIELDFLQHAKDIALYHQEKWDGSGYPMGLKGDDIPFSARLMALADVYDALISERVYKPPFSHDYAVELITEGRGSHFDPDVTAAFLSIHEQFRAIALEFADE